MRFLDLKPKTAAKNISSTSYIITGKVCNISSVLMDRLSTAIERHLRKRAESIIIAKHDADSASFDRECAIHYPKALNKKNLQENHRVRHVWPCFAEEGALGDWVVHVDAKLTEHLEDSALRRMRDLWSNPPWTLVFMAPVPLLRYTLQEVGTFISFSFEVFIFFRISSFLEASPGWSVSLSPQGVESSRPPILLVRKRHLVELVLRRRNLPASAAAPPMALPIAAPPTHAPA
jgi:hypothetical protein